MHTWFECKIRYEKTMDNGMNKKVTEPYLVDALSFTEAEARIIEEMTPFISGEFTVSDIKRANYSELFPCEEDSADRWFKCKLVFITLDEKSGAEKKTSTQVLVQAETPLLHPKSKATMTLEEMLQMERKRKKKQKYDDEEHRIQCSCVKWFNLKYPKLKGRLFAVPNGGRRDTVTGGKLKAEGVTAGVSDLILLKSNRDYGALLIEMKKKGGYQSPSQKEWQKIICENGEYKYVLCFSLDDFIREVDDYLRNEF